MEVTSYNTVVNLKDNQFLEISEDTKYGFKTALKGGNIRNMSQLGISLFIISHQLLLYRMDLDQVKVEKEQELSELHER